MTNTGLDSQIATCEQHQFNENRLILTPTPYFFIILMTSNPFPTSTNTVFQLIKKLDIVLRARNCIIAKH